MDLNKVMIIGRLTRDPELRTLPTGSSVCKMGVATGYVYTNQQTGQKVEQTEFHNVTMWSKLGEIAGQYLKKGSRVYIEGRLQTQQWDGQDGTKKSRTEIIADNMIMLDSKGASGGTSAPQSPAPSSFATKKPTSRDEQVVDFPEEELPVIQAGDDIRVEDIPF
jgi:single-strand DNA-binding protein